MTHRIDLGELLDQYVPELDAVQRDELEAALYAWRDEAVVETPEESAAIVDQNLRSLGSAGLADSEAPDA